MEVTKCVYSSNLNLLPSFQLRSPIFVPPENLQSPQGYNWLSFCSQVSRFAMSDQAATLPSGQTSTIDVSEQRTPAASYHDGSEIVISADQEKADTTPEAASPPPEMMRTVKGWRWVLICFGFYFSAFLYGLDNTIAADIQSAVVDTYGDISKLTWLGTGFPLGSIATILTL